MTTTTPPLDLSSHKPPTGSDQWIAEYQAKMGIDAFYEYQKNLCDLLYKMEVGQSLHITDWAKSENYDLFVKLAHLFLSDSQCCYQPNKEFTIIKRQCDAREMEKTLRILAEIRRNKDNGNDGAGTGSESSGTAPLPTPQSPVQRAA